MITKVSQLEKETFHSKSASQKYFLKLFFNYFTTQSFFFNF